MESTSWTTPGVFAGPGGVLTEDGGTLTGELTVHTEWEQGRARVTVQYQDGGERYALAGSPIACPDPGVSRTVHQSAVEAVRAGGAVRFAPRVIPAA
ncbi:hypothetical protein [Streptomyces sp. NPDC086023]|uniref:hypothetical protein n=1 Tax=Streptomyces sp. NPDC086023 TaxID=3365746 RepID=UPI0037CF1D6A